jgi:YhcH/YjgK/YiaL family protein
MIIDSLLNAEKYFKLHENFAHAFEYIKTKDFTSIEPGKYEIEGDELKATVIGKHGMSAEESIAKFECHNKYIDIQVCISGVEQIGWKPRISCIDPNGEYNPEKDVMFYSDAPDMYFQLTAGQFAIFYPGDVHAPMIGEGEIKKLVIKVKL